LAASEALPVSTTRIHWHDLPAAVRAAIEARTGPVLAAETAAEGRNCELAAFVRTAAGWHTASAQAISVFAAASARLWAEIARDDPQPWKQHMSAAARQWLAYRKSPAGPAELAG
jgi:hypothetical protein